MQLIDKQDLIRRIARENAYLPDGEKILWSRHAVAALVDEPLSRLDVKGALQHSTVTSLVQVGI